MMRSKRARTTLTIGVVLAVAFTLLGACEGAGNTGADDDMPPEAFGAIDGSVYGYMEFRESEPSVTYVWLRPGEDDNSDGLFVTLTDQTEDPALDAGVYDYGSYGTAWTFSSAFIGTTYDAPGGTHGVPYVANTDASQAGYEAKEGHKVEYYDHIVDGTVTVAESAGEYAITWEFETTDGRNLVGSYTGTPVDTSEP